jgi:hypothetical protein
MTRLKLTEPQEDFLKIAGNVVVTASGSTYYYMPFWYRKTDAPGIYEIHDLDHVPQELKEVIIDLREKIMSDEK